MAATPKPVTIRVPAEEVRDLLDELMSVADAINGYAELVTATVKVPDANLIVTYADSEWTLEVQP